MEKAKRTRPSESSKRGAYELTGKDAASRVYMGLNQVLCIYIKSLAKCFYWTLKYEKECVLSLVPALETFSPMYKFDIKFELSYYF